MDNYKYKTKEDMGTDIMCREAGQRKTLQNYKTLIVSITILSTELNTYKLVATKFDTELDAYE